jgi:hypothetical protein
MARVGDALLVSSAAEPVVWVLDPNTLQLRKTIQVDNTAHQLVNMP